MDCYHSVYTDDLAAEINEFLQDVGSDHRVEAGAHDWSYGYGPRISPEYLAPYCILAGILVLDCGSYGFEGQGPSFGADAYGRAELAEAEQQLALLDSPSAQQTTPSAPPQAAPKPASRKLFGRIPINIWTIFAGIIVLLLMAECVDNTIYNFTGTQG
ncbi:hypothetical protein KUL25_06515 [Rhodobacteraceae bacterium N5(2021)]|uniref:Uncharacterized protein n=1 Tax=Gymnodinialimonas phycosphaerae TaxID=2841589 RepID=A0A975TXE4_9RHOB|nr:hypothetical protein [Gymnodinialimonas phycosphaerae]MBY4892412.1 hypothetical protein [Gymnodinialimonas phycosphaerae]